MKPRKIPEIPIKLNNDAQHRAVLVSMREQITQLTGRLAVPDPPTGVRVTPQAFQNLVQWTKSTDADYYEVMSALKPNQNDSSAFITDVGDSASWQDTVGNANIQKFYWVRGRKLTGASSVWTSVAQGTTLASGTGVTPPNPPAVGNIIVLDQNTGLQIAYALTGVRQLRGN